MNIEDNSVTSSGGKKITLNEMELFVLKCLTDDLNSINIGNPADKLIVTKAVLFLKKITFNSGASYKAAHVQLFHPEKENVFGSDNDVEKHRKITVPLKG